MQRISAAFFIVFHLPYKINSLPVCVGKECDAIMRSSMLYGHIFHKIWSFKSVFIPLRQRNIPHLAIIIIVLCAYTR